MTYFSVTPEVATNVQLYWYPWEGVQIRAGYNFMAFFNTQAAEDPVAFDARSFDPDWKSRGCGSSTGSTWVSDSSSNQPDL